MKVRWNAIVVRKKIYSNASCKYGHYTFCDNCHSLDAFEVIKNYCMVTTNR